MDEDRGLLGSGWSIVMHNKRYVFWFWLLNLVLALFGTAAFSYHASAILDHSFYSDRMVHGFDLGVFIEMLARPEFGPMEASSIPAMYFVPLFVLAMALFLPGVYEGYAANYRLPRDEFFRACGRNLWRYIRLLIVAGIVMLVVSGALFMVHSALVKKAEDSTNELLPFETKVATLAIIFLLMTVLRIWFDLAEADVVLNDQRAVRRSIGAGFQHAFQSMGRLVGSYLVTTIVAAIILVAGLLAWMKFVPAPSVIGAFLIGQLTLLLLLIPRFWQRGIAVAYWKQKMIMPMAPVFPITRDPIPPPVPVVPVPPSAPAVGEV
jgi:hypothetical protein